MVETEIRGFSGECEEESPQGDVRQGDIFEWLPPHGEGRLGGLGLVVTADCDIAYEKHRGVISYVPIVTSIDYLTEFILPQKMERALKAAKDHLLSRVRGAGNDQAAALSAEALDDWIEGRGIEGLIEDLKVADAEKAQSIRDGHLAIWGAAAALEDPHFESLCESLLKVQAVSGARKNPGKRLSQELASALERLPGDSFFIGRISADHDEGYVAYLRHVREIPHGAIAIRTPDLERDDAQAKRVTRLKSPYVYRCTQLLADVFSAIGLPEAYEERRAEMASSVFVNEERTPNGEQL